MTVGEVIDILNSLPKDIECLLAIDHSAGFQDDYMEIHPVERVFKEDIQKVEPRAEGYWYGEDGDKVLFYVYP